jgi:hypothetical protein
VHMPLAFCFCFDITSKHVIMFFRHEIITNYAIIRGSNTILVPEVHGKDQARV